MGVISRNGSIGDTVLTLQGDENEVIETLTEQDRRRIARERELESDLAAAADLMGSTGVEDGKSPLSCPYQ
jgi:hypothetical protein